MGKTPVKTARKTNQPARKPAPKPDYDKGIREQLEPYGLVLDDIVAVLETDPSMMQYLTQGAKGESLAKAGHRSKESTGYCATGAKKTTRISSATSIAGGNGNDIQLAAQATGDYFSLTYHTAETPDTLKYAPHGAMLSWENQDNPDNRKHPIPNKNPGGFMYGHVTFKTGDNTFFSDHPENTEGNINLVLHKGRNKGPRYGSLSYVSFPKDVTFSPELIQLALTRKRERESDRVIPLNEIPKQPDVKKMTAFFKQNPRICYLMLKQINPNVPFSLTKDGGGELINYYNQLPSNSPERAALNLLVSKDIKDVMNYTEVNTAIEAVSDDVLRLRNPEAYARHLPATEKQINLLCDLTPTYIYQLQQTLTGNAKRMTSQEFKDYIAKLDKNSPEYLAISELAKKEISPNADNAEVKLAIANIAQNYRNVTEEEIKNLFENTPALVYHVQKEFGTQKETGIRITSELHEYYNSLPQDSRERKAIDELAMAHIGISETKVPNLDKAVQTMAHHYQPNREKDPVATVHLTKQEPTPKANAPAVPDKTMGRAPQEQDNVILSADRAAICAGFEKMDEQKWTNLVDDYLKSTQTDDKKETKEAMKQQKEEASMHFETTLQSLFTNDGTSDCKAFMIQSKELLDEYLTLDGTAKSLEGFIKFVKTKPEETNKNSKTSNAPKISLSKGNER